MPFPGQRKILFSENNIYQLHYCSAANRLTSATSAIFYVSKNGVAIELCVFRKHRGKFEKTVHCLLMNLIWYLKCYEISMNILCIL